jgi:hypothetical protein
VSYIVDQTIKNLYPNIEFVFVYFTGFDQFYQYNTHLAQDFKNLLCSFNGSDHIGRKLLLSTLHRWGWFNKDYSTKNIVYSADQIHGHLQELVGDKANFYSKFILDHNANEYHQSIVTVNYDKHDHLSNIQNLESRLTESFLHLVSETLPTSYYPFVTEKFLYSVVTRGLFLAYAQPGWHAHLEAYFGFKNYTKLFDYQFDNIQNPVERLIELMSMISKFSMLTLDDWRDLYLLEQDTIEYNYDHYFSQNYLKYLASHT